MSDKAKKKLLFEFDDLAKENAPALVRKELKKFLKVDIANLEVNAKVKRSSGISYREVFVGFADSQTMTMRIKNTGDIYQVLLNGKLLPIKEQEDHVKAVGEIAAKLDAGRSAFQKLLAKAKVDVPKAIKTSAAKMEVVLTEKRDALKEAISGIDVEIAGLQTQLAG